MDGVDHEPLLARSLAQPARLRRCRGVAGRTRIHCRQPRCLLRSRAGDRLRTQGRGTPAAGAASGSDAGRPGRIQLCRSGRDPGYPGRHCDEPPDARARIPEKSAGAGNATVGSPAAVEEGQMNPAVSDEILHAFIDGELDVAESETLIARTQQDPALAQRVCALRSLRSMVKLAYAEPPVIDARPPVHRRQLMQRCAFGCLVLLVGLSSGWALRGLAWQADVTQPAAVPDGYRTVSLAREADPNRIILHIDSAAPEKMRAALDRADQLLDDADRQGRAMQLEVIANSHGLELLRAGHSPYAERIARMRQRHANLQWVACGQTVARYTSEGQKVELLPATRTAPTAIGEIISRLQQGWTYVRV